MKNKLIILLIFLASCGVQHQEKKFVLFHDRHDDIAVKYCAKWYPIKDSIYEVPYYIPSVDTITLPGEPIYVNCDSVYIAALDEASKHGTKLSIPKIQVPTNIKLVHDTIRLESIHYQTDTKQLTALNIKYNDQSERLSVSKSKLTSSRIFGAVGWFGLLIIGLIILIHKKLKHLNLLNPKI